MYRDNDQPVPLRPPAPRDGVVRGQVIAPFIAGLTWAAVLVVAFRPFHRRLQHACGSRQWVATTILTLLVAAFVIVPVTLAAVQALQGGIAGYHWVESYQGTLSGPTVAERWPWLVDLGERGKRCSASPT
jgi:predicted PurR-regulated permease PerM